MCVFLINCHQGHSHFYSRVVNTRTFSHFSSFPLFSLISVYFYFGPPGERNALVTERRSQDLPGESSTRRIKLRKKTRKNWRRVGENNRWMRKYSSLAHPSMATPCGYNFHLPLWQLTQFSILINLHWKTNINSSFGCLKSHPYSWSLWCNYTSYWSTMASHDHRR